MAQSLFEDLPQAQGYWNVNLSKAAVLFGQLVGGGGTVTIPTSNPGAGAQPAPVGFVREYVYWFSTNNIRKITYKQDGAVTGAVYFTYIAGAVADDDDLATETWGAS